MGVADGAPAEAVVAPWERSRRWRIVRWIHRRRPLLTFLLVAAALLHSLLTGARPADLLDPSPGWRFWAPWALMVFGAGVRLWGSGNLRKNQEITRSGVYVLVRHPLYLGSLVFLLSYFLTIGDAGVGLVLFVVLAGGVYYPTMRSEERELELSFPEQYASYRPPPRFFPDVTRLREATSTDRFTASAAYGNLGFRSVWFLVGLPILLRVVRAAQEVLGG